jgi:GT2 family glycosyltransferase
MPDLQIPESRTLPTMIESSALPLPLPQPQAGVARVSVVIVVWNAQKYVLECLGSLREHCQKLCAEVIVVDNASTDGTPELVAEMFPEFKVIRNRENLGFAKANNIGITECSGDYICLVNSDVKFLDDCISPMVRYLSEHPGVAMLGPKMLAADGEVRRSTMRFPTVWNNFCRAIGIDSLFKRSRLFGGMMMSDFDHQTTGPVEVLNGWFLVVRRRAIERVGLLDAQFFMYGEDVDWCYRFRQAGEQVVFFAEAGAIHYGGASSANAPVRFYLELYRATWQYWRKHRGGLAQLGFLASFAIHHAIRLVASGLLYLCSPSRRTPTAARFKRSLACLQWVGAARFRQLETSKKAAPTRAIAS